MLIGTFENSITDKNRLAIPKKIREEFNGKLIISRGYEGCLIMMDESRWDRLYKIISKEPILNLSVRDTYRFILAGAKELEVDKQGRVVMPEFLIEYAGLTTEVSFLGMNDWVEIWDRDKWMVKLNTLSKSASDIADRLMKL